MVNKFNLFHMEFIPKDWLSWVIQIGHYDVKRLYFNYLENQFKNNIKKAKEIMNEKTKKSSHKEKPPAKGNH
jgi:hypothetical protein